MYPVVLTQTRKPSPTWSSWPNPASPWTPAPITPSATCPSPCDCTPTRGSPGSRSTPSTRRWKSTPRCSPPGPRTLFVPVAARYATACTATRPSPSARPGRPRLSFTDRSVCVKQPKPGFVFRCPFPGLVERHCSLAPLRLAPVYCRCFSHPSNVKSMVTIWWKYNVNAVAIGTTFSDNLTTCRVFVFTITTMR